ncbi:hypothetical protein A33Q_2928 [Indibacter alkaliphilus LW1]|uniref:Uncharacterized protein n=1 Tax=Indibacter alkaliphilus (strain CCUG 57479 / KCTC 22604 / LW1) TaxID=1189612 RepID=S2DU39_INDAL|nr:hypothetical protein A33Q_2928 [Indibacter alkaliphilus LW1]
MHIVVFESSHKINFFLDIQYPVQKDCQLNKITLSAILSTE